MTVDGLDEARALREEAEGLIEADNPDELEEALKLLDRAVELSEPAWESMRDVPNGSPTEQQRKVGDELIETYGVTGGAYRRRHDFEKALRYYERGAILEVKLRLDNTYNRVNSIKWSIRLDKKSIDQLQATIRDTLELLERQTDEVRGSRKRDAWAWADLGDCRALLGDEPGALLAYDRFLDLAGVDDATSPLGVLREIAKKLPQGKPSTAVHAIMNRLEGAE